MPTATIIGAGIAGLASAIALRRAGFDVQIIDRAPVLAPVGAALSMWANAVDALDALGCGEAFRAVATPIDSMGVFTRQGRAIIGPRRVIDTPHVGARAFMVTRAALQSVLLDAVDPECVTLGTNVASVDQYADGVTIALSSGEVLRADLAIIADGIWSESAATLISGVPRHAGYGGVLALSNPIVDAGGAGCAHEYWDDGARFGLFDIGSGRRYWFYMRNELQPNEAHTLTYDQVAAAARGWPDAIAAVIAATPADRLIPFSIHAKPPPDRLGRGRIIAVGDAAHAMEPNLGQGACQAIEDAIALGVAARAQPLGSILPTLERLRIKRIARYVNQSAEGSRPAHSRSRLTRTALRVAFGIAPAMLTDRVIASLHALPDYQALAQSDQAGR